MQLVSLGLTLYIKIHISVYILFVILKYAPIIRSSNYHHRLVAINITTCLSGRDG